MGSLKLRLTIEEEERNVLFCSSFFVTLPLKWEPGGKVLGTTAGGKRWHNGKIEKHAKKGREEEQASKAGNEAQPAPEGV